MRSTERSCVAAQDGTTTRPMNARYDRPARKSEVTLEVDPTHAVGNGRVREMEPGSTRTTGE
jgi:acyl-coenzyme A thioesterase PaaI-like protein